MSPHRGCGSFSGGLAAFSGIEGELASRWRHDGADSGSFGHDQNAVLILAMGREQWSEDECRLWSDLRGPRLAVNLKGAEHVTPSDAVWLAKGAIKTGPWGQRKRSWRCEITSLRFSTRIFGADRSSADRTICGLP